MKNGWYLNFLVENTVGETFAASRAFGVGLVTGPTRLAIIAECGRPEKIEPASEQMTCTSIFYASLTIFCSIFPHLTILYQQTDRAVKIRKK